MRKPIPPAVALRIYKLLEEFVGASDFWRDNFVYSVGEGGVTEFRFQGSLGFGGKFRHGSDGRWYVDCYREDETPARLADIAAVNAALAERERYVSTLPKP